MSDPLSDWEVAERIRLADNHLRKFRLNDLAASNRFIDFNGQTVGSDSEWESLKTRNLDTDVPDVVPIGQTNWLAVMSLIKSASISMSFPQLSIKCHESPPKPGPDGKPQPKAKNSDIVEKALKQFGKKGGWVRIMTAALQKYDICGLGAIRFYYDPKWGPMIEHVTSNRLLIDHDCTNFNLLEWGGAHVQMSLRKILRTYPSKKDLFAGLDMSEEPDQNTLDSSYEKISLYYEDDGEQVHVWNDGDDHDSELFRGKNLYGRVPLCFMLAWSDPRGHMLPLGENVFATGMAQEVVHLHNNISNTAKNGGALNLYSEPMLQDSTKVAIQEGQQQQWIGIKGPMTQTNLPVHRIPAEEISNSIQVATQQAMAYLRAIVGVDASAAGEEAQKGVTATQAVMAHARGAAMPTMVRTKYEELWAEVLTEVVKMVAEFGGKKKGEQVSTEQDVVHEAFESCYEVMVVPGSTSYQPLATDQQAVMQLYTTVMQSLPAWEAQALRGITDWVPNIQKLYRDLLQAFGRLEDEDYQTAAPPPPPPEQSIPPDMMKALQTIYAKSPLDVQGEILQKFGLKPSQMQPEGDGGEAAHGILALAAEHGMQTQKEQHEKELQESKHVHDFQMETLRSLSQAHTQAETNGKPKSK